MSMPNPFLTPCFLVENLGYSLILSSFDEFCIKDHDSIRWGFFSHSSSLSFIISNGRCCCVYWLGPAHSRSVWVLRSSLCHSLDRIAVYKELGAVPRMVNNALGLDGLATYDAVEFAECDTILV